MTKEEFDLALAKLHEDYSSKRKETIKKFCLANNPYKVGDIFTDHIGSIKIELIKFAYNNFSHNSIPCCVYYGAELKKDGTPRKDGSKRSAWQSNDISIN